MVPSQPPEGFSIPDFAAPLDVAAHLAMVPATATVKGTIAQSTVDALVAAGKPKPAKSYAPFRDYPTKELIELNIESVRVLFPDAPLREGLRQLGRNLFPTFTQTLIGKVMYGVFGGNIASILKLANKSYEMTQNTGKVKTQVLAERVVQLNFASSYTFLSSFHYGVLEGTLEACKAGGAVYFKPGASPNDGDFYVAWEPRGAAR